MTAFSRSKMLELAQLLTQETDKIAADDHPISVNVALTKLAVLYEKMRNAVDYKEDHRLRKAAIIRILKRQVVFESDATGIAQRLIRELISAGYAANNVLPESLIQRVALVITKWQVLTEAGAASGEHGAWLIGVIGAEIEELVDARRGERRLSHFLFEQLANRITMRGIDDEQRCLQIEIACHRLMLKADDEILSWMLLRTFLPVWTEPEAWLHDPRQMAAVLPAWEERIRQDLAHPWQGKFLSAVKPWAVSILVLRDVLKEHPGQVESWSVHPEALWPEIIKVTDRQHELSKKKLRRGTIRAIIYLLLTKVLLALALEVPIESFLYHRVSEVALTVNILFPPVLMLVVGSLIQVPGKENQQRIRQCVEQLLSESGPSITDIKTPVERRGFGDFMFGVLYALTFVLIFGGLFMSLLSFEFTWISALIFLFFLCVVSFFAFRLRHAAREYIVVNRRDTVMSQILDFLSLPILRAGQWLSVSISRINIFLFIFDFIIETPYKIFLEVLEEWLAYLKEKRDELQ